jgi:ABC-type thiamine transport system ATPase subunit
MSGIQYPFGTTYETVPASTTAQVMGQTGAVGDTLVNVVATVGTSATSQLTIIDGSTSYVLIPNSTPVGVYSLEINANSLNGAWKITTAAGVTALVTGNFS